MTASASEPLPAPPVVVPGEPTTAGIPHSVAEDVLGILTGTFVASFGLFLLRETNRPLYADPFAGNTASVRLLEKHGFRRTGTVQYGDNEHIMLVLDADGS
jgi:hypothetical protein